MTATRRERVQRSTRVARWRRHILTARVDESYARTGIAARLVDDFLDSRVPGTLPWVCIIGSAPSGARRRVPHAACLPDHGPRPARPRRGDPRLPVADVRSKVSEGLGDVLHANRRLIRAIFRVPVCGSRAAKVSLAFCRKCVLPQVAFCRKLRFAASGF